MSPTFLDIIVRVLPWVLVCITWIIVIKYSKENKELKKEIEDLKKRT